MSLATLPQYHFDRDDFCKVFEEVFTYDEYIEIDVLCGARTDLSDFFLFRWEDEFYILHRNSGILINWYKHMGRTNTCNKPDFTLDDFREFLMELRKDLVWEGLIKDDALYAMGILNEQESMRRLYAEAIDAIRKYANNY